MSVVGNVIQRNGEITATRRVSDSGAVGSFVVGSTMGDLDIELVIRVGLLEDSRANSKDVQHPGRGAAEYDDRQHHYYEHCGSQCRCVHARHSRSQSNSNSTTQSRPEQHSLIGEWQFVRNILATTSSPISDEPIHGLGQGENGQVSCHTDAKDSNHDEERLELQVTLNEQIQPQIDENEVFAQLRQHLEEILGSELRPPRHVVIRVVLEGNSAEKE